jgi:hypothetical protein
MDSGSEAVVELERHWFPEFQSPKLEQCSGRSQAQLELD